MAKRSQALPFIWGYKTLLNNIVKRSKEIIDPYTPNLVDALINYPDVVNVQFNNIDSKLKESISKDVDKLNLASERSNNIKRIAEILALSVSGWSAGSRNELVDHYIGSRKDSYNTGTNDARRKLITALKKYTGILKNKISALIRALRKEIVSIPVSINSNIPTQAGRDYNEAISSYTRGAVILAATVIIKKRSTQEEKQKEIEKKLIVYVKEAKPLIAKAKDITSDMLSKALWGYYVLQNVPKHQWVVDNPVDDLCIQPAGEIVKVGEPFSNGFLFPLVHKYGHCTTIPVNLTTPYILLLLGKFGIESEN